MRDTSALMQIGELARRASVSPRTIHYYESLGLLAPAERQGQGYRYYDGEALRRLARIEQLKRLGLTLEEIGRVLDSYFADPAGDPEGLQGKREVLRLLEQHLAEADRRLEDLQRFRDDLIGKIARVRAMIDAANAAAAAVLLRRASGQRAAAGESEPVG